MNNVDRLAAAICTAIAVWVASDYRWKGGFLWVCKRFDLDAEVARKHLLRALTE